MFDEQLTLHYSRVNQTIALDLTVGNSDDRSVCPAATFQSRRPVRLFLFFFFFLAECTDEFSRRAAGLIPRTLNLLRVRAPLSHGYP